MSSTAKQMYDLLPAIYRIRDAEQGEVLKSLLAVMAEQAGVVEDDIARLYDNWFIETCDEWVVPYIGDLLGVRGLKPISRAPFSQRPQVANTIRYRRRKGTAPVLEQLARDVTGWPARVVEFFQLLGTTQNLNHLRPANVRTPDFHDVNALELIGSPFETAAHTVEVRRIASRRGKYNIPNIGLFLWRLQDYAVTRGTARAVVEPNDGRFAFDPLGYIAPLFNRPQTETEITHLAEEINVPGMLRRRPLYDELEALRQASLDNEAPRYVYFNPDQPVLQIFVGSQSDPIPPEQILICDLSDPPTPIPEGWQRPPTTKNYQPKKGGAAQALPIQVAVDPVLGRIAYPLGVTPSTVEVSYAYGFSGDVGGGPYNRRDSVAKVLRDLVSKALIRPVDWQMGVTQIASGGQTDLAKTLTEAVQEWNNQPPGANGIIAIMDSRTYQENLTGNNAIKIPAGSQLLIVAADWPQVELNGVPQRVKGQLSPDQRRPHLRGNLSVKGTASATSENPGTFIVDGLLIEGKVTVLAGNLGSLRVAHSTLVPDHGGLGANPDNSRLKVTLERSICGPIALPDTVPQLSMLESIVDAAGIGAAISASGAAADIQTSTIFETTKVRSLDAGNSLFTDVITAERRQVGCVRFCYVPTGSQVARRFRCQRDLALTKRAQELKLASVEDLPTAESALILARLQAAFNSVYYGEPEYAQLSQTCAEEIRTGAEDGAEMGVWGILKQPQREANLRLRLDEYLRFGLEAGIFFVT